MQIRALAMSQRPDQEPSSTGRDAMDQHSRSALAIPGIVRRRAESLGEEGIRWLATLEATVEGIRDDWGLRLGEILQGGSEAFVAEVVMPGGRPAVLKIGLPGSESGRQEAQVLLAARGRGYAAIFRYDSTRRAMLLEKLGPPLSDLQLPVEEQMRIICTTLVRAWRPPPRGVRFQTGAEKAESLAEFIEQMVEKVGPISSSQVIDRAFAYAHSRKAAYSETSAVLAHGDAHASNTLRVPGPGPRRFKFIDPDGILIEPAYDLAILMRAWGAPLLEGNAAALGWERAQFLGDLTGVAPRATWEWGFIERVSTGLLLKHLGQDEESAEYLAVAEQWLAHR